MGESTLPRPANSIVQVSDSGEPWIRGYRCGDCGAVASEPTIACRRCASRNSPEPFRSCCTGKLFTWSVVERSYPGVAVPFISAIIDLDDGLTLKGTLRNADPEALEAGMPVVLLFDDAGGVRDESGTSYVSYHFVPGNRDLSRGAGQ